jgi:hypothetical protein
LLQLTSWGNLYTSCGLVVVVDILSAVTQPTVRTPLVCARDLTQSWHPIRRKFAKMLKSLRNAMFAIMNCLDIAGWLSAGGFLATFCRWDSSYHALGLRLRLREYYKNSDASWVASNSHALCIPCSSGYVSFRPRPRPT